MDALTNFFALTDAYRASTGLAEATVSRLVLKGGNRIRDLRAGNADIGVYRVEEATRWFSENWPEGAEWPTAVPRPAAPVESAQSPEAA